MKIKLSTDDELYPMIVTSVEYGREYEIPDELGKEFIKTEDKYFELQAKVGKICNEYDKNRSKKMAQSV